MTNFTSSVGRSASRLGQCIFAASPLPGHLTSITRTTPVGTRSAAPWPPVSSSTVRPSAISRSISGYTSFCSSGSPPVISTTSQPYPRTCSTTSSTAIRRPSWNAYDVSHHEQRRSQAVNRTNTQGRPAWVDSPWIEWKISLIVSISPKPALYLALQSRHGEGHLLLKADVNDLPERQEFPGRAVAGRGRGRHQQAAAGPRLSREARGRGALPRFREHAQPRVERASAAEVEKGSHRPHAETAEPDPPADPDQRVHRRI